MSQRNHDKARQVARNRRADETARQEYIAAINRAQRVSPDAAQSAEREYAPLLKAIWDKRKERRRRGKGR